MRPPLRPLIALTVLAVSAAAGASPLPAQEARSPRLGVVEGQALGAEGTPLGYALIVLVSVEDLTRRRPKLTEPDGSFRFENVVPGEYRLRLERIGFRTESSPVLAVRAGEVVAHTVTSAPEPVRIEGIVADGACFTGDRLGERPYLAALWAEAQKNAEYRRAFESQYSYVYTLRQENIRVLRRGRGEQVVHDTIEHLIQRDPESIAEHERDSHRRRNAFGRELVSGEVAAVLEPRGLGGGVLRLDLPEDRELLGRDFLRTHCLEARVERVDGSWEFGFRAVRKQRGRIDVQGTILVDTLTFRVSSLHFEYLNGDRPFMEATVHYGDFAVPGGMVRLPTRGSFSGRPLGRRWDHIRRVEGTVDFTDHGQLRAVQASR